jgi:hypothetical protein
MGGEQLFGAAAIGEGGFDKGGDESLEIEGRLREEGAESRPAWEALLAGDGELGGVEGGGTADARESGGVAGLGGV